MNIAIINGIFFPAPGGAQIQIHNFANKFIELGHNVDNYIFNPTQITNNNYNILLINKFLTSLVFFLEFHLNINISFILRLYFKKIINKNKYDIWYFNFINFKSLIIINCLKKLQQKVIVTFQGADIQIDHKINYGYRLNKKYNCYFLKTIPKVDLFISISNTIKEDLLNIGIDNCKIVNLPNTVDIKKFKNMYNSISKLKTKKFKLITVARFSEKKKGYDLLPILAEKLFENKVEFVWTIVGDGTRMLLNNNFIKNNKKLFDIHENIDNKNENYFPHSKLIKKYINSDLYVNLARIESFGITFLETMAVGTPIISFNSKGANEIILNNHNGYIIFSDYIKDMAKKIENLAHKKSKDNNLNNNCILSVQKYDLELVSKKLLNVFKQIC